MVYISRGRVPVTSLASLLLYFFYSYGKYDLVTCDEVVYFSTGLTEKLPYQSFNNLLYPLIIKGVIAVTPSYVDAIYSLNFFMSALVFVGSYLAGVRHLKHWGVAYLLANLFLFSSFQIHLVPRITLFNLGVMFWGLYFMDFRQERYKNWIIATVVLLLGSFASRPEYFYFFVFSFFVSVYRVAKSSSPKKGAIYLIMVGGLFLLLSYLAHGYNEPDKLKIAFVQHFFDNYFVWTGQTFGYDEEFAVFDKIYGKVTKDTDLITSNFPMFLKHTTYNACRYFLVAGKFFKDVFYTPIVLVFKEAGKYVLLLSLLALFFIVDFRKTIDRIIDQVGEYKSVFGFIFLFMLGGCVAVIIIYPRHHYVVTHWVFYFFVIGILFSNFQFRHPLLGRVLKTGYVILAFAGLFVGRPAVKDQTPTSNFYREMTRILGQKPHNILSNDRFGITVINNTNKLRRIPLTSYTLETANYDAVLILGDLEDKNFIKEVQQSRVLNKYVQIHRYDAINKILYVKPELAAEFKKLL